MMISRRLLQDCFLHLSVFVLLFLPVVVVKAQSYQGCYGENRDIAIGKQTLVCLQVGNNVNWTAGVDYVRAAFEPLSDQYSKFHIPNSYKDLVADNSSSAIFNTPEIVIGSAAQDALSFLRVYYNSTGDSDAERKIYPFLTSILNVDQGVVKYITWDDACVFCGGFGECEENTYNYNGVAQTQQTSGQPTKSCYFTKEYCDKLQEDNAEKPAEEQNYACDITLYVVWSGTDVYGQALQSQAYRFSAFPVQNIEDAITQAIPTFGLTDRRRRAMQEEAMEVFSADL